MNSLNKKKNNLDKLKNSSINSKKKRIFNLNFVIYLLLVSISVTAFFNSVFNQRELSDIFGLFTLILMITALVLFFLLKNEKNSLEKLGNQSVIGFIIFVFISILVLLVRKILQLNIFTRDGAVFSAISILLLVITYNFIKILSGIS